VLRRYSPQAKNLQGVVPSSSSTAPPAGENINPEGVASSSSTPPPPTEENIEATPS
ncbi:hypothetical protein A2U01_0020883, partial [Trifolium medium]|nr:hypothetical protein [Trifolium medium]